MEPKSSSKDLDEQPSEQIPSRSISKQRLVSTHLISPVKTNRKQPILIEDDELNKNISSEYQDIQIRTLTKWINVQLSQADEHITRIDKDLKDGKKLLKLLSVVANNPNLKPERGNMRIHELSNVAQALKFLQDQWGADSLPAVASEAIVNGDVKSTLAITFFIMLKYQIHPILLHKAQNSTAAISSAPSTPLPSLSSTTRANNAKPLQEAKLALLYWVRSQLEDYVTHHILSTIQDFSRSWRSGLAFCLLTHRHNPDLLPTLFTDYIQYASQKETWHRLLTLAFDVAEERLKIPKYLEPADLLVEYPHEPSVMMYVSEMYKVMSTYQQETLQKKEKRLRDIALVSSIPPAHTPILNDTVVETEEEEEKRTISEPFNDEDQVQEPKVLAVKEQLDVLSSLLDDSANEVDTVKLQTLLENTNHTINQMHSSSEERQVLSSQFNQLKERWEQLIKSLESTAEHHQPQYHPSGFASSLRRQLKEIVPMTDDKNKLLHPLDGTFAIAEEFERSLSHISTLAESSQEEDDDKDALRKELDEMQTMCHLFRRGVTFAQITSAINDELSTIQQMMAASGTSDTTVTDAMIQSLEQRIHVVNTTIQGVRNEYGHDLLHEPARQDDAYQGRFMNRIDDLEERYETVRDWVDQVRVWFVEAERIRAWIDRHIQIVEQRNEADDNFDPVSREITIADDVAVQLHKEHERLKQEIDRFDSDDMDRLRAHVKMLTTQSLDTKDLTPADTSTIEITLTTLNKLSLLTKLVEQRSHRIQLLLLRVKWEDLFGNAVQWIASTDKALDAFLRGKARWSEKEELSYNTSTTFDYMNEEESIETTNDGGIEGTIKTLVSLERKIADFDRGSYSDVLDAYQEMETLRNETMPDYLEARQLGFENAFEDLMKRSGFSRKVVEQLLSMINMVEKFKELRDRGEHLRQSLLQEVSAVSLLDDDDDIGYAEKVQTFKEESARLITNASTYIPYPTPPEMSTAMGANDAHDTEITNESIKSAISAYSMSLALIADGLDQLLMSRYQIMSLQQRAEEAYEAMTRVRNWMEERIKMLNKTQLDIVLYDPSMTYSSSLAAESTDPHQMQRKSSGFHNNNNSSSSNGNGAKMSVLSDHLPTSVMDNEKLLYFEKERDMIASRLDQIENDELMKLLENVRELEYDVDALNAVSIDRNTLVNNIESLEQSHKQLKEALALRTLDLDTLKYRLEWEAQWARSNSHLHTIARKMCDFNIKKTRYDPCKENIDRPSYQGDHETVQTLAFLKDRVAELGERYLIPLAESYSELVDSFTRITHKKDGTPSSLTVPDFILNRQADLKFKYEDLKLLTVYTSELVTQRSTITEFLLRAQDTFHEGEKIKEAIFKRTRRVMASDESDASAHLETRVDRYKQEIKSIWEDCGEKMPYPVYNGRWLKTSPQTRSQQHAPTFNDGTNVTANSTYRSQVRAQIKALLDQKMEELSKLSKSIDQCMQLYYEAERTKSVVKQYELEACELGKWIDEQIETLKSQHIDVSAETFLAPGLDISDLKKLRIEMFLEVESFEDSKVKALHDCIEVFMKKSIESQKNPPVDMSLVARQLGEIMDHLAQLKRGLSDQAVTLDAASVRAEWESQLLIGKTKLEEMNEDLRQFNVKKNLWASQDDLSEEHVQILQQNIAQLTQKKNKFLEFTLPGIQMSYESFVEYFPKLSKPIATPDYLEARMESLSRTSARLQENVEARTRELDLIKQCLQWEDIVRQAIVFLSQHESLIETFVEEKARWRNDSSSKSSSINDDDEEITLRTELSTLFTKFRDYEHDVIAPLEERFEAIVQEASEHYSNVALLPNSFTKKMQDVQKARDRTNYYLDFSNDVVSQRCLLSAFILRTAQLEQSAEMIREEFIAGDNDSRLKNHAERLDKFKAGIDDVRNHLTATIPFPVRSLEDISTQAKIKDEATNSVIRETIDIRNSRLEELWSSLQLLLESKERVSRRRYSLHSFKKQAQLAEAWILSRHEILDQSDLSIDSADIEKLKESVSQVDGVERAMKAAENVMTLLTVAYEQSIAAFKEMSALENEEDDQLLAQEIDDIVKPTQVRITESWNGLLSKVIATNKTRTALLIETKIRLWIKTLDNFSSLIGASKPSTVDSVQLSSWMGEIDHLEIKSYENLKTDLKANKQLMDMHQIEAAEKSLFDGKETAKAIRVKLIELQNRFYFDQLVGKFVSNISKLFDLISEQTSEMNTIIEKYSVINHEQSSEIRQSLHLSLVSEYKEASKSITNLKDLYNDVSSQYTAIIAENPTYENARYQEITAAWRSLEEHENNLSALIARIFNWNKYFDALSTLQKDLQDTSKKMNAVDFTEYCETNATLDAIESSFTSEFYDLPNNLHEDTVNSKAFISQRTVLLNRLKDMKSTLKDQMTETEKTSLIQAINETVERLCTQCKEQLTKVQKHYDTTTFYGANDNMNISHIIDECNSIIESSKAVYSICQTELETLGMNQLSILLSMFGNTDDRLDQLLEPVVTLLEEIDGAIKSEKCCLSIADLLSQFTENKATVLAVIDDVSNRLYSCKNSSQTIAEIERQVESLDELIQEAVKLSQSIRGLNCDDLSQSDSRVENVSTIVNNGENDINNSYLEFKRQLHKAQETVDNINKCNEIIAQLSSLLRFVNDMIEKVDLIQLSGTDIESDNQEITGFCDDFYPTLNKKTKSIDSLIASYAKAIENNNINSLQQQVSAALEQLDTLIKAKKKKASVEGDLSGFLRIMDEFDKQITLLMSTIEQASPHHSSIVNNKFVKSELQTLLKVLVTAFKQHQQTVNDILKRARDESNKRLLDNNERVIESLQKATKRWTQTQATAAARERELQACINQLDHEFFMKLAMAKSSSRTSHRGMQPSPNLSPSNTKRYIVANDKTIGRVLPFSVNNKRDDTVGGKRLFNNIHSSGNKTRNKYVPDPESELDMELGHIVNSSPYRVTVKVVPGQVGKYWFGDVNPRLVYCRILPSRIVMVRVGGGWVELSKFLRDHGLTEGIYSRPESVNDNSNTTYQQENTMPFQETYIQTLRSSSPSGRVTIRGGGGVDRHNSSLASTRSSSKSSGSRSRSPLPGYVDGDKYISTDEAGNQIILKMIKADDDAKTPVIIKKK
ncbi:MAG: hypothetical protein EXX96DRAFT_506832 [Benjaminiella poitrasii]|nr:MAG: hypothetical protein EXX96DRAFT_506832 [Benjaminiella poitrasii]